MIFKMINDIVLHLFFISGGSLPPLVPADPEAMLGQGYIPVLVSDEEHFAAGAGQMMMHGDAPSEPEQCEEQAGGQELDSR